MLEKKHLPLHNNNMIKIENFMKVTITTLEGISVRNPNIKQIVYYGHHQHQGICIHGDTDDSATPSLPKRIPVRVLLSTSEGHGRARGPRLHGKRLQTTHPRLASLQPLTVAHSGRVLWPQSVAYLMSDA